MIRKRGADTDARKYRTAVQTETSGMCLYACRNDYPANRLVIGNIYCGNRDFEAKEIGYIVNKRYQRQGYAAEALSAVIAQAFKDGVHRIYAECDLRNVPSWKLLEKVGLRREAHFRQNIWFRRDENGNPIWKDTLVYTILENDMVR